jgi:hypothetical protein
MKGMIGWSGTFSFPPLRVIGFPWGGTTVVVNFDITNNPCLMFAWSFMRKG